MDSSAGASSPAAAVEQVAEAAAAVSAVENGTVELPNLESGVLPVAGINAQSLPAMFKGLCDSVDDVILPDVTDVERQMMTSYSFAAYISMLDSHTQQQITANVNSDVASWICDVFGIMNTSLLFHTSLTDGLTQLVKMCLHVKYPEYAVSGYEALRVRPPVLYTSAATRRSVVLQLCRSLALPEGAVRLVPGGLQGGHAMDVAALERMMEEDRTAGSLPLMVLTHAGTPDLGHVDDLEAVAELCRRLGVWAHVAGANLSVMALTAHKPVQGDSMTLDLGRWLHLPWLPAVTLYRHPASDTADIEGATVSNPPLPAAPILSQSLPYWAALLCLGRAGVVARIEEAFSLSLQVENLLTQIPNLRILSLPPGKHYRITSLKKVVGKDVNPISLMEQLSPVVVFRYMNNTEDHTQSSMYSDNLNSWLAQIMQRDLPEVCVQLADVEGIGFCLRFAPLLEVNVPGVQLEAAALNQWAQCLHQQVEILNATVLHQRRFQQVAGCGGEGEGTDGGGPLRRVPLSNWAGLGAVRYIPAHLISSVQQAALSDNGKEDINKLNMELLNKLQNTDSAFSLGEGDDGMVCIRFGMVTMDTDVDELFALLVELGSEIEENSRYLESMSELVIKNIETASADLRRQNEDRLWQEGVLRQVPLVGTFVNWWSPQSQPADNGRRLDLAEGVGVLETTEETYKLRAQTRRSVSAAGDEKEQHSRHSSLSLEQKEISSNVEEVPATS